MYLVAFLQILDRRRSFKIVVKAVNLMLFYITMKSPLASFVNFLWTPYFHQNCLKVKNPKKQLTSEYLADLQFVLGML